MTATAPGHGTPGYRELAALVRAPVRFARGLLRVDPWEMQARILRSVAEHRRTAVKACHSSGKTHIAAAALMWWVMRYSDGIVVTTAPTWTQVEKLLWGKVHATAARSLIAFPPIHKTELGLGPDNYALGLSTNEGVRFQGWHGRILVILDEAPGVLPEIYDAIDGIRAGGHVHELLLGNPIITGGKFYDVFHQQRATWQTFTISAFDVPNFDGVCLDNGRTGVEHIRYGSPDPSARNLLEMTAEELDTNVRPYLTTRRWVREMWDEWGPGNPLWESKVLGQFPSQGANALLPLAFLELAAPMLPGYESEPLDVGIDVKGPGEDEHVVSIRQGPNRIALRHWTAPDPRGEVLAFLRPYKDRIRVVNVDSVGVGYYYALGLQDEGFPVRMVNVGETDGVDRERFANLKSELYWNLRERALERRLGGITDPAEIAQLASILYHHDPSGRVVIDSKDKLRREVPGLKSPDRAEADMLAFAPPIPDEPGVIIPASTSYLTLG